MQADSLAASLTLARMGSSVAEVLASVNGPCVLCATSTLEDAYSSKSGTSLGQSGGEK